MITFEPVQHSTDYGYEDKLTILSSPIRSDDADHELVLIGN